MSPDRCCVLCGGDGAWAFAPLAEKLAHAIGIEVSGTPRDYNYLLYWDRADTLPIGQTFIPFDAIRLASDKRLLVPAFHREQVPTPETHLFGTKQEVHEFLANSDREWCLKFPTACGASGHRLLTDENAIPERWSPPYLVQEFVRLERPEVYRTYIAGEDVFGWVVRRFPEGTKPSPWVAHARGARYEVLGEPPTEAILTARQAFQATGLHGSFGCVDLLQRPSGEWLVLEVGTDGQFNHVDRELGHRDFENQMERRIAEAFWAKLA